MVIQVRFPAGASDEGPTHLECGCVIGSPAAPAVDLIPSPSPQPTAASIKRQNRGARIRTGDLTDPNGARYQTAPRPDARRVFHTHARR